MSEQSSKNSSSATKHPLKEVVEGEPDQVKSLADSILTDLILFRYDYVEEMFRNFPSYMGRWMRYRIIRHYFKGVGKNVAVWPGNHFRAPQNIEVGDNVGFAFGGTYQAGGGLTVGNDTLFAPHVKVWTVNHMFKDKDRPINTQGFEKRPVEIGNDCWIGSNSFIKPGTILPDGCVVSPYSMVGRMKIPPYSVLGGNPAKVLGPRDKLGAFMGWSKKK